MKASKNSVGSSTSKKVSFFGNFCKNYLSTIVFLLVIAWHLEHMMYYANFFGPWAIVGSGEHHIMAQTLLHYALGFYAITLVPFYLAYPARSKARVIIEFLFDRVRGRWSPNAEEVRSAKQASLAWLVKIFFVPLMVHWLGEHSVYMLVNISNLADQVNAGNQTFLMLFQSTLFWSVLQCIFFVDVAFFTFGYLIEAPFLKNSILSVESTAFGWLVCLICYPPFNSALSSVLPWMSNDFPNFLQFFPPWLHIALNVAVLILMGIYASASVALGLRASNLTNRGVVTSGPYALVRHPAYVTKNMAWWIGAIPALIIAWNTGIAPFILGIESLIVWSVIYFLRAITEEQHLRRENPDYAQYEKRVKYRFIPGII